MDPSEFVSFELPYAHTTVLHPLVFFFLSFALIAVMTGKRQNIIIYILIAQNFITSAQRVSVLGMDFPILRLLFLFAFARNVLRNEHLYFKPTTLDRIVVFYSVALPVVATCLEPGPRAFISAAGISVFDVLISYMVVRFSIRDIDEFNILIKTMIVISLPIVLLFINEQVTKNNIMSFMIGVPPTPNIREGRMRLQGAYPHPILAGSYWASLIPLFIGMASSTKGQTIVKLATVGFSMLIVLLCASSTPVISVLIGFFACVFFYQRASLKSVLLTGVLGIVVLAVFWKHPVWYLFTKIDVSGGSTGYYRFLLVDAFIRYWRDWFFFGVKDTLYWGMGLGLNYAGLRDLANQYVAEGVGGGILGLGSFIAAIGCAFSFIGRLIQSTEDEKRKFQYWTIGVSIVVFLFNFCGVSYFGSLKYSWWITLAICACLYQRYALDSQVAVEYPESLLGAGKTC